VERLASKPSIVATSGLLHPVALVAIAVWLVNEYWLHAAYPNVVTDKLSALAGLVAFPLVIAALVGVGLPARYYPRVVDGCLIACGIGFALIKLWEPATDAGEWILRHMSPQSDGVIERDAADLLALPMLLVSRWCYRSARRRDGETGEAG
jgi:hypothetical protein